MRSGTSETARKAHAPAPCGRAEGASRGNEENIERQELFNAESLRKLREEVCSE